MHVDSGLRAQGVAFRIAVGITGLCRDCQKVTNDLREFLESNQIFKQSLQCCPGSAKI